MTMTAGIGLGILVWILVALPVTLFVARMIRLRDHRHSERATSQAPPAEAEQGDDTESFRR